MTVKSMNAPSAAMRWMEFWRKPRGIMAEIEDGQVHDAGMLAAAQTVEH
jgi:ferritin-like metal-binding protein YciE